MRRTNRSRWVYRLGILGALGTGAAVWTFGCTRSESTLPESIQKKIRDDDQSSTSREEDKLRPTVASDGVTTRFTVRPFEDWTMREAAAVALGRIGEPAVPALVDALRSHDPEMRLQAADTLARIGPGASQAVPSLTELLEDEDIRVRKAAARALGQIGPKAAESVPSLMRALESPP